MIFRIMIFHVVFMSCMFQPLFSKGQNWAIQALEPVVYFNDFLPMKSTSQKNYLYLNKVIKYLGGQQQEVSTDSIAYVFKNHSKFKKFKKVTYLYGADSIIEVNRKDNNINTTKYYFVDSFLRLKVGETGDSNIYVVNNRAIRKYVNNQCTSVFSYDTGKSFEGENIVTIKLEGNCYKSKIEMSILYLKNNVFRRKLNPTSSSDWNAIFYEYNNKGIIK